MDTKSITISKVSWSAPGTVWHRDEKRLLRKKYKTRSGLPKERNWKCKPWVPQAHELWGNWLNAKAPLVCALNTCQWQSYGSRKSCINMVTKAVTHVKLLVTSIELKSLNKLLFTFSTDIFIYSLGHLCLSLRCLKVILPFWISLHSNSSNENVLFKIAFISVDSCVRFRSK